MGGTVKNPTVVTVSLLDSMMKAMWDDKFGTRFMVYLKNKSINGEWGSRYRYVAVPPGDSRQAKRQRIQEFAASVASVDVNPSEIIKGTETTAAKRSEPVHEPDDLAYDSDDSRETSRRKRRMRKEREALLAEDAKRNQTKPGYEDKKPAAIPSNEAKPVSATTATGIDTPTAICAPPPQELLTKIPIKF